MRVGVVDLTNGEPTPNGTVERRAAETERATQLLGLSWRACLNLPNRSLEPTLEARRRVAETMRLTRPRMVLCPYWEDAHPDHLAACQLVEAGRFWAKLTRTDMAGEPCIPPRLLYYFSIHLRIHPQPAVVIDVSGVHDRKLEAIRCFESQFADQGHAFPTALDDIRDRGRYWGWSIGAAYGEPLASREQLGLSDLTPLWAEEHV
jgi:bacillithiol biosynthesis deacetylase BshB1